MAEENNKYGSAMEVKKKAASIRAHIDLISKNFGIPLLEIKYEDLDRVDTMLSEFFRLDGESNG
jgi:hypothetical protein